MFRSPSRDLSVRRRSRPCLELLEARTLLNGAPVLTNPGNQANTENDYVSLQIAATDPDNDNLTFSASGLPSGLTIEPIGGAITGTVDYEAAGTYVVTVSVTDDQNPPVTIQFEWTVANKNRPPEFMSDPEDLTVFEGEEVWVSYMVTDADNDTVLFSASGLPSWLSIDPYSGAITGTVPEGLTSDATYAITITADDGQDAVSKQFVIQAVAFAVNSVTITPPAGWNGTVGANWVEFTVTITGVGAPPVGSPGASINWSVWDNDEFDPDDELKSRASLAITSNAPGGAFTETVTFRLRRNANGYVEGADGHSGQTAAEVYVHIDTLLGRNLRDSAQVTVTAAP